MAACSLCGEQLLEGAPAVRHHMATAHQLGHVEPLADEPEAGDPIHFPRHYTRGRLQPLEVIEDWRLGFNLGNVVKYIARHEHKGSALDDLRKARFYLDREIRFREGGDTT